MKKVDKKNIGKKIVKVLTARGFYVLLALSLGILGISSYIAGTKREIAKINTLSQTAPVVWEMKEPLSPTPPPTPPPQQMASGIAFQTGEEQPTEPVVAVAAKPKVPKLMLPLQGELTNEFSGDTLVYDKTMDDWRVHSGIDIRGDVGSQVQAVADGVVISASDYALNGFTVVLEHEGGLRTLYSNLQTNEVVKKDQRVKKGDVIGGVGKDAMFEIALPPHLHFEVHKDGAPVDPFAFMD